MILTIRILRTAPFIELLSLSQSFSQSVRYKLSHDLHALNKPAKWLRWNIVLATSTLEWIYSVARIYLVIILFSFIRIISINFGVSPTDERESKRLKASWENKRVERINIHIFFIHFALRISTMLLGWRTLQGEKLKVKRWKCVYWKWKCKKD